MIALHAKGKTPQRTVRKRVTLIAAFRTEQGVAICADSQETAGDYRQTVQKIAPLSVAGYQLVIAGSGDADLIEGFIIRVERRFSLETLPPTADHALFLLEDELALFYKHDIPSDQSMKLFIAVSRPATKEYKVWVSYNHILKELGDAEVIGWEHPLYKVTVKRMYRPSMSLQQAVIAAVNVLVIGEESSNYIKGPFSLAIVRENGIWIEDEDYINTLRDRLKTFERYTNQILLACSDTSIYSHHLEAAIIKFAVTAKELHKEQIDAAVAKLAKVGLFMNDPVNKLPVGLLINVDKDGNARAVHDVNGIEEMVRKVNEALSKQPKEES